MCTMQKLCLIFYFQRSKCFGTSKKTIKGLAQEEQLEVKISLRMQGETEPVEAYVQDVLNICYKIDHDMLERSKIHGLRGLKPSLLEIVIVGNLEERGRKMDESYAISVIDEVTTRLPATHRTRETVQGVAK